MLQKVMLPRYSVYTVILLAAVAGSLNGQCEEPLVLMPQNSSGNLAFPKANLDPVSGTWNNNYLYPQSASCTWILKAPPGHVINMRFIHFSTEEKFDYVSMFASEDKTNQLFHYSGDLKEDWESATPDNVLVITFNSDEFTSYQGFQLAYRYLPKACVPGGFRIQENQLVALPPWNLQGALPGPARENYYPASSDGDNHLGPYWVDVASYPQGLNCTWIVDPIKKHVTQIEVLGFQTSPTDVLQVLQFDGKKLRPLLKFWDGNIPQSKILSTLPLTMNFFSSVNTPSSGSGFLLNITYISQACSSESQHVTTPKGYIAYPEANLQGGNWGTETKIYYGSDSCSWILEAPEGYVLNVTVVHFATNPQDKLTILDDGQELFNYGGSTPSIISILSKSSKINMNFSSDSDSQKTGFLLKYSWVLKKCNYTLEPTEGILKSPYYPDPYGEQVRCLWTLDPKTDSEIVHFSIIRLSLDEGDFLQISDGRKNSLFTADDSTNKNLLELHPQKSVTVNFLSDSSSNKGYFYMRYNVFEPGNCNFELTSCGWTSVDKMKLWNLEANQGIITVQEPLGVSEELPRGYQAMLSSPYLSLKHTGNAVLGKAPTEPRSFCFGFTYLLNGQDAYKLKVVVEERKQDTESTWRESSNTIFETVGPQGTKFLKVSVNFTVIGEFQVNIVYEKGYGPHYQASISSVELKESHCSAEENTQEINCDFHNSFCGWQNTHTDHQNWLLGDNGISTLSKLNSGHSWHNQYADLISPTLHRANILTSSSKSSCLSLQYRIHSHLTELKVLVSSKAKSGIATFIAEQSFQKEIWSVGGFHSTVLNANIPLIWKAIPDKFEIILRAVTRKPNIRSKMESYIEGITVSNVSLSNEEYPKINSCSFEEGFCSWFVISPGESVWKIQQKPDNLEDRYIALHSKEHATESSYLLSPLLDLSTQRKLSFMYILSGGREQCLQMSTTNDQITAPTLSNNALWQQCKNKGKHRLYECIDLPIRTVMEHIVFANVNNDPESILHLDDIEITDGACRREQIDSPETIWQCKPHRTMCEMTQLMSGSWDWSYEAIEELQPEIQDKEKSFFRCASGDKIPIELQCNGIAECPGTDDELQCGESFPGKGTKSLNSTTDTAFCTDGRAINVVWLCDGIMDCPDGSDELNCNQKDQNQESCSGKDFLCPTGIACHNFACPPGVARCLSPEFVCDSVPHCNHGEDEQNCPVFIDPNNAWRSYPPAKDEDGLSISQFNAPDEENSEFIECYGGLLLPKSFRCDGRKDCPRDGRDEIGCHHCSGTDFLCPTSGVCIPWSSVCDGELSIDTCTDEDFCDQCPPGHFACDICITSNQVCDGVWDCELGEDETRCMSMYHHNQMMGDDPGYNYGQKTLECQPNQFSCPEGRCIPQSSVCDRRIDCRLGDDEIMCPNDNLEVETYIKAQHVGSKIEPATLITPQLYIKKEEIGILSFQYRFDLWIGASNVSVSIEVLHADDTSKSIYPWSIWRQSVHKDQLWMKANVFIPFMEDHPSFKLGFVVQGKPSLSGSEKLHFANLKFQSVHENKAPAKLTNVGSCDFHNSWCGWTQPFSQNGYGWMHGKVSSRSNRRTGPISGYEHGQSSGFLYADSQDGEPEDFADLLSPVLVLPPDGICLRFMVFMYGFDIGSLFLLTGQKSGEHIFSKEILHIQGSQGMSWFPVTLQINDTHLSDINEPLLLIIRSQRGSGTEGDIAIDHIQLDSGPCIHSTHDPTIFLKAYQQSTSKEILMMKSGRPLSSYTPPVVPLVDGTKKTYAQLDEFCSGMSSCTECVSSSIIKCNWCDEGHFCVSEVSPRSAICADNLLILHNTTTKGKFGANWCPQLVADDFSTKISPLYAPINHNFAVMNIRPSHADLAWKCVYKLPKSSDYTEYEEMNFLRTIESDASNEELWAMLKGFAVNENKHLYNNTTEVPANFKGSAQRLDPNANQSEIILVGRITCGDDQTTLQFQSEEIPTAVNVDLITPSGSKLDNPHGVQVSIYNCPNMASDCKKCVSLDSHFDCGWCQSLEQCTEESQCIKGKWDSKSRDPKSTCSMREELQLFSQLLQLESEDSDFEVDSLSSDDEYTPITKKKVGKGMKKSLGSLRYESESKSKKSSKKPKEKRKDSHKKKDRHERLKGKNEAKKMKKRSFLRIPIEEEVFVARSSWRLHTGRQYYVPVKTKTLVNLGFVRQVIFGKLEDAKSRTVLVEGKWKKAIGFYVDLFEKNDSEPVVSIITTKKSVFDQLLKQMDQKI